jgi:hypothetical protein
MLWLNSEYAERKTVNFFPLDSGWTLPEETVVLRNSCSGADCDRYSSEKVSQHTCLFNHMTHDSQYSQCAMGWTDGESGFDSQGGQRFFSLTWHSDLSSCPPASYPIATSSVFSWNKAGWAWSWQPTPSSLAKVSNMWSCISIFQCVLVAWCLIKHKDNNFVALEGCQYFIKTFPFRLTFIRVINMRQEQQKRWWWLWWWGSLYLYQMNVAVEWGAVLFCPQDVPG